MDEVKRLEGWMTFLEAGLELGYSKQGMHRLVFVSPRSPFNPETDLRGVGDRPLMLLREEAVMKVKKRLLPDVGWGRSRLSHDDQESDENQEPDIDAVTE